MSWLSKESSKSSEKTNGFELNKQELDRKSEEKMLSSKSYQNKDAHIIELQKSGLKLQLVQKLIEIDKYHKQSIFEYKENIQAYNIEIEKLGNQIDLESESCDKEESKLLLIEHELLFETKIYDQLQVKFSQYISSIEELKYEYKDVIDEVQYQATLKRKEKELSDVLDDIETSELSLLNKELLRLNVLGIVEPKKKNLKSLEMALKELAMKKAHYESIGLDKVSNPALGNKSFWRQEPEVVDTVEIEDKS